MHVHVYGCVVDTNKTGTYFPLHSPMVLSVVKTLFEGTFLCGNIFFSFEQC